MANRVQLKAEGRTVLGKKVNRLRREGILPATVYGQHLEPKSIQIQAHELREVLHHAGTTQLIDLVIDGEVARPVVIRQMGRDVRRNVVSHVEFFQPDLLVKLTTHVPLSFTGESPAVKAGGVFLSMIDHVDVESLPQNVPEAIEVDISAIEEVNGTLHVSDLTVPENVSLLTAPDEVVAKVNAPSVAAEPVEEAAVAAEAPAEQPEGEAAPE